MALREERTMKAEIFFPVVNQVECTPVKKVGWGEKRCFWRLHFILLFGCRATCDAEGSCCGPPPPSFIAWQCVNCNAYDSHILGCEHHKVRFLFFLR